MQHAQRQRAARSPAPADILGISLSLPIGSPTVTTSPGPDPDLSSTMQADPSLTGGLGSASATSTEAVSDSATDSGSDTHTDTGSVSLPMTSPPTTASVSPTAKGTGPLGGQVEPASSNSKSIFTSVLVKTTATVNGHLTTYQTLVPTTLSAFPDQAHQPLKPPALAGTIIGTLLAAALLAVLGYLFHRRRRQRIAASQTTVIRPRGRVLEDGEEDDDEMAFHGMSASGSGGPRTMSSHGPLSSGGTHQSGDPFQGGSYQYGSYGSGLPEMRDPAQVRAARASRTGSSSGSIFREELGMDSPTRASIFADPKPIDHRTSTYSTEPRRTSAYGGVEDRRYKSSIATDPLLGASTSPSPTGFVPRSESPTSFSPPIPPRNPRRGSSSSVASSSYPYAYPPPSLSISPPRKRSSGGSTASPLPPGASPALGPMARNSVSVEEKFQVRNASTATFDPMETERMRRDSYVLPDLHMKGDGDLRSLDNGSRVNLKPYLSGDEDDARSSRTGR